jgi:hypothetical protein
MKKGPLEFKRPKFWEERDGGLIPPIARFHLRTAGSKFKGEAEETESPSLVPSMTEQPQLAATSRGSM